ncbi:MAG: hypothetical protein H6Q13_2868 [Bacteroidetes bacterium]|jgi:hypothetical protein|nr:hypothetical protein [Bacteroidota bacterium]
MKKIIYALLSFFLACGFQSCANDEEEVFDKSASERMSETLANCSDILQAPKNGWLLKYYAGTGYSYGGYNMIVSFADGKVTAASEIASPDAVYRSSYALVSDQGPVLSFNTYNPILHFFGSPSFGSLDGYQGDFEFVIMSASADSIVLKGKKWANKMVMTPMAESTDWETYLNSIVQIESENPYVDYKGVVDNKNVKLSFSDSWHVISVEVGDSVVSTPGFIYSPTGITFYTPVNIAGHSFESLTWNATDTIFSGKATDGTLGSFKVYISPEYKKYLGTWSVDINGTLYSMLVSEKTPGQSFIVSGPELPFPFVATYNSADDKISITTQTVGEYDGYIVKLCPWDAEAGYLTQTEGIGMESKITSTSPLTLSFSDNGVWSNYTVNSYILYLFDSADDYIGAYSGGTYQFPYINGAVKDN